MLSKISRHHVLSFSGTLLLLVVLQKALGILFYTTDWSPVGPGRWLQHPGPMMDPQVSYAFFFDLLIAKTLPYFLTGTLASLLFGRLGSKLSLLFGFLYAAFVVPVDGPTPEGQVIRWLMTYIRVATVSLGIGVSQALLNVAAKLRAGYSRPRQ